MRGNHWNTWEKYLPAESAGRARSRNCWKAWGDVLPFESINETMSQECKYWRTWERFLPTAGLGSDMGSIPLEVPNLPEKVST